jgi:tetratricopeptide (TPR) repeat protein
MAVSMGDASAARAWAEEALAVNRDLGDSHRIATSEFLLGLALADEDELSEAERLFEDSMRRFGELGAEEYVLVTARMLAWMSYRLGDRERGLELHEDNLRRARRLGIKQVEASTLDALGMIALDDGRLDAAAAYLRASDAGRDTSDRVGVARHLCRVARVLAASGRVDAAAALLAYAEARLEEMGVAPRPWLAEINARTHADIAAKLDEVALREARNQGRAYDADQALELAHDALA